MPGKDIKELLTLDYEMIIEAIRRLEDGTDCSVDDDKISALDLFNRMKLTFKNHIYFENNTLSLIMSHTHDEKIKDLCSKMQEEHLYLSGLIETIGHELADTHPSSFKAVLTALRRGLQSHLEIEKSIPIGQWIANLDEKSVIQIGKRTAEDIGGLL